MPTTPTAASEVEAPRGILKVTWPDIVHLVDQHPRSAAGLLNVTAARAAVSAARAVPNPSLDATIGRGAARDGDLQRLETGLELTVPLGWIAQRRHKVAAARAELDASKNEAEVLRRDVLLQLRVLFWNLAYDQARVGALTVLESQTAELARSVQRRVEKGEARPVEQSRIEVELEKVASDLEEARISLHVNREQLQLWLGGGKELLVEADLSVVPKALDLDLALAKAQSTHPSIKAAQARVQALSSELTVEKLARIPSVALRAFTQEELDRRAHGGGLSVDLPLWNWNSGGIARAEAQLAAGEKQLEAQAREIASSIIESHGACLAASQSATRLKERILPRSEAAASTMERTYQLGEASLFEAIDARRVLVETRRQYLAALGQAQIDCSRFNALVGEEDDS
jgi:cobalt-zinc-cadmium efflux system outer membrane protein